MASEGKLQSVNAFETKFMDWYKKLVAERASQGLMLSQNPDDPRHFYDHRSAFRAGVDPTSGHLPSEFKLPGNPRMFLHLTLGPNGEWVEDPQGPLMNTKTMKPATEQEAAQNTKIYEQKMREMADWERAMNQTSRKQSLLP